MLTCDVSLDFTTIGFNGQTYGVCLSGSVGQRSAKVSVGAITGNGWQRNLISWPLINPQKVVAFVDEDPDTKDYNLYVLAADSASRDGTNVYVINRNNKMITKEQHTVNSQFPTAIAVWRSRTDNSYHLAIANSYGKDSTQTYKSETFTYNWMQTYFDRYSQMTTYYVKDICAFIIHSNEFIAVANYKAGPNHLEVESEIFKLDIDRKKWRSFQRIRTFGATDWEFFTFGDNDRNREYFLAVANNFAVINGQMAYNVDSIIYKFSDDKFVPFQPLPTIGATQIKSYTGPNGEFVLAVASVHQPVHLYQYNGWNFIDANVQYAAGVMGPGAVSLHFNYLPIDSSGVLIVSNPTQPTGHVFRVEFIHENPLGDWHNRSLEWCLATDWDVNQNTIKPLKDVFFVDQSEPIVINNDFILSDIVIDFLQTPYLIDDTNGDELSHKLIENLLELDREISAAEVKMNQIVDTMANAMRTSGDQLVTAPLAFNSVDFDCRPEMQCFVGHIQTNVLNGDNVQNLANDIVLLDRDQSINQTMHFQELIADKNIILNGLLNGVNTNDIVTKSGSHVITGPKTFANNVTTNEVIVNHLINGEIINPTTVLLTTGDQVINNSITFKDNIVMNNLQMNGPINGIIIDKFYDEVVTKDGNHIIRGDKSFKDLDLMELIMRKGSTIDGIDIMRLWSDVLWTYGNQDIDSAINFTDIAIDGNLVVDGLVNGVKLPNDIIKKNENAVISGNKQFLETIRLDQMNVLKAINGIGLVGQHLDVMSRSTQQLVLGQKVFNGLHLGGHSPVKGTVDGVKLSQFKQSLVLRNTSQHFDELEIGGNALFDGGLDLKTSVNGFNIQDLYQKALKLTDTRIQAFPNFQMNNAFMKSLECPAINNLNIGRDLMTKNTPQVISGQKVFANGFNSDNNLNIDYINGLSLDFFNDTLFHGTNQVITGEKVFLGDLWVKNLKVNTINNISMQDIVLLNSDEVIIAPKDFSDVKVYGDLNVQSVESDVINGVQMKQLYENSLQFEKPQIMTGRLNFESIDIPKATNFETNSVNGINLRHLMSDAVLTDVPQYISGAKTFISPVTVGAVNFGHTFDNVSDYELKHNWLLQDIQQTINSDVIFDNFVHINDNIFMNKPIVNKIDLNVVNNNTVKVDESALIGGHSSFVGSVTSSGHIQLSGKIQGIDLDKEAVLLNGDNVFEGSIHFANGFNGGQHLFVNGTVDDVVVEDLCRNAVRKNQNQMITGPTQVTGDLYVKGPIDVNIGLNGVNLEDFYRNTLKVDEPLTIRGLKRFRQLVINGPIHTKQTIADFKVEELVNNYMSLSRDQTVNSKIVFLNDLTIGQNLRVNRQLYTQNASINGLDLRQLDATVLKTFGNQLITGDFTFENDVYFDKDLNVVNKRVNNLNLYNDLMLRGRDNVVTVPKIFTQDIVVNNDLKIKDNKTIGGIDISEMARYSILRNGGKYTIFGQKHINNLEVDHLRARLINGLEVSERTLLLNYGNQLITGVKILNNNLNANSEINSKTINHISIQNLSQNLVLKGYNNTIHATKTFNSPIDVHNVRAYGRVDGVDLHELNYFMGLPVDLQDLRVRLGREDTKIQSLQRALDQQWSELAFYELYATIPSGPALHTYYNTITDSQHLFISGQHLANGCQEIEVYVNSRNGFEIMSKLFAIESNLMTSFTSNGQQFVIITNSKSHSQWQQCIQMNTLNNLIHSGSGPLVSQVFVFNGQQNKYIQTAVIHSQSVTDLKVIEDNTANPCLLMAIPVMNRVSSQSIVVCMQPNGNFYLRETVPLLGRDQVSIMRSTSFNRTLMASIKSWSKKDWMSDISISDWSSHLQHFDHSVQTIPFLNPYAIHFVDIPSDLTAYLFASERKTSLTHNPLVRIFRYNHKRVGPLQEVQQLSDLEVIQIDSVFLDNKKVLVLMLSKDTLFLYQLKGSSGFQKVDQMDVQNAKSFIVSNYELNGQIVGHLIAVSYQDCYDRNENNCYKETHVLNAKFVSK